jgi:ornithine decarboxylase
MVMAPSVLNPADDVYTFNKHHFHSKDPTLLHIDHGVNDVLAVGGHPDPKDLILDQLKSRVAQVDISGCEPGEEDAFYVADMGEIYRQHMRWKLNLSRVKPFYGMHIPL